MKIPFDSWNKKGGYFYIPLDAKMSISQKNIKVCQYITYVLSVFGAVMMIVELVCWRPVILMNVLYYFSYVAAGFVFNALAYFAGKKRNYFLNQFLLLLYCSYIIILLLVDVSRALDIDYIIAFYFAVCTMMILFELHPLFYTSAIISFFFELLYLNVLLRGFNIYVQLNNGIFCVAMILFAFYKRHLVAQREWYKSEIEEKNKLLTVQNIELERQKDTLLSSKEFLENTVFNQSQEIQLQKERLIRIQNNTIIGLSSLVENRDEDTGEHVLRTREYVGIIALNAFLSGDYKELNEQVINLYLKAAPMHDIGKIVVPDAILKKPGKLTEEEFEAIKVHTTKGGEIIEKILGPGADPEYVRIAKEIATFHHEKYDGCGYPMQLKGENIPLSARTMAIADVFDALISPRCYKEPMPVDEAFAIIQQSAGAHFDPELTKIFIDAKDQILGVVQKYQ